MNKKTLKALNESIEKWTRHMNVDLEYLDQFYLGPEECPLCQLFWHNDCQGCPVFERTGLYGCENTPFDDAYHCAAMNDLKAFKKAAQEEVNFLKSLLPEKGESQ